MLRFEQGVAEDVRGGGHGDVLGGGEGGPEFVEEGTVVYAEGWGNAAAEASPVLGEGEGQCGVRDGWGGCGLWNHSFRPIRRGRR